MYKKNTMDRLTLPKVDRLQLPYWNRIIGCPVVAPFSLHDEEYAFRFVRHLGNIPIAMSLHLKVGKTNLWVALQEMPENWVFPTHHVAVNLQALSPSFLTIVLETALAELFVQIETSLQVSVRIEQVLFSAPPEEGETCRASFTIRQEEGPVQLRGYLLLPARKLSKLAQWVKRCPRVDQMQRFGDIPLFFRIILGQISLSREEYKSLALQDIILLNERHQCWVVLGKQLCMLALLEGKRVKIKQKMDDFLDNLEDLEENLPDEEVPLKQEPTDEEESDASSPEEVVEPEEEEDDFSEEKARNPLENIPVQLLFEAGKKQIALRELGSINPGYTFELDSAVERPITIRANGKIIGTGELVEIGDRIGVRILEFTKYDGS